MISVFTTAASQSCSDLDWFYTQLIKRFKTKNPGEISKILGKRVTRNRMTRELFLDQEKYLEKVLNGMGLLLKSSSTGKPKLIPMSGKYEKLEQSRPEEARINRTEYQQKIGSLMFAAVCTRPDIAFHIGRLSQQLQDSVERHSSGFKEIGRYLRKTISQTIRYGPAKQTNLDGQNTNTS